MLQQSSIDQIAEKGSFMMETKVILGDALPAWSDEAWWRRPREVKCAYTERPHGLLHYRIVTPRSPLRPPVFVLHQSGSSGRCYEHFAAALGQDRIVVVPDTPGFGASDPLPHAPQIADFAAQAVSLAKELGFASVDVFGDHTGTKTAVELGVTEPELVRRIVLHSPVIFDEEELRHLRAKDANIASWKDDGSHFLPGWDWRRGNMACAPVVLRQMEFVESLRSGPFAGHGHHASLQYEMAENLRKVQQRTCVLRLKDYWDAIARTKPLVKEGVFVELPDFGRESPTMRHRQLAEIVREFLDAD